MNFIASWEKLFQTESLAAQTLAALPVILTLAEKAPLGSDGEYSEDEAADMFYVCSDQI